MAKKGRTTKVPTVVDVPMVTPVERRRNEADLPALERARAALAEIRSLTQHSVETVWELGQALARFLERKHYVPLGYSNFATCLAGEHIMSEAQAHKLVRIARRFSRDEMVMLGGVDKADRLIAYAKATTGVDTPAGLVASDALIGQIPLSQASAEDIARETRNARAARLESASASENRRTQKARDDLARERWVKRQLKALGWKAVALTTRGRKVVIALDADTLDRLR